MAELIWVWHEQAFTYVFKSWPGPVGRHIDSIADRTVNLGRGFIGKKYAGVSSRSGSGRLARSLRVVHRFAPNRDVEAHAGANPTGRIVGYAIFHHEGTGVHGGRGVYPIVPRRASRLRFYWVKAGGVVYLKRVRHPGSPAQEYLTKALRIAMS
jgi:hypothetical protein